MAPKPALECRSCRAPLDQLLVDLGMSPIANAFRPPDALSEQVFPLRAYVCTACWLVQLLDVAARDAHFHEGYAYFSSYAQSWVDHAGRYAEMAAARFGLGPDSLVVEVASNDGYLLQFFKAAGIPVLGVEPAANCAAVAQRERGIATEVCFFGHDTARRIVERHGQADLIAANNVLAHVPDLNDFVAGLAALLRPSGVVTVEFPHLLRMLEARYFDTIYHEHYSYLSVLALEPLFARHRLSLFDLEELPTHGGSLRLFISHHRAGPKPSAALEAFRKRERATGLDTLRPYLAFRRQVVAVKRTLLRLLIDLSERGKTIAAYGAPAKGVTLLNYCGIGAEFVDYAVDRNPCKQGRMLPGTSIPIHAPEQIWQTQPDFLLILPWNLREEIVTQMAGIRRWGGKFIVPLPEPEILP